MEIKTCSAVECQCLEFAEVFFVSLSEPCYKISFTKYKLNTDFGLMVQTFLWIVHAPFCAAISY